MKLLIYITIALLLFSCKKGKADFVLSGKVIDQTFNQNLVGADVKLYQVPVASTSLEQIGSGTIGADGMYSFKFQRDKMEKYILKISKTGYFDIDKTVYFSELSIDDENVRNLSTTAKSWVKLTFINSNPLPGDQLKYIKQLGKEGCAECCSDQEQNYMGALDTSIYCINDGNAMYSYMYWIIGTSNQGVKSVTTTAFDTSEIILNY